MVASTCHARHGGVGFVTSTQSTLEAPAVARRPRWRWNGRSLTPEHRRLLWFGATVESLLVAAVILAFQGGKGWGLDAWAYWSVDPVDPYSQTVGQYGAFLYGPPFAQVFGVLGQLPWPVFLSAWTGLLICIYAWITKRYALVLLGLFPSAILELINGNIHLLLAAAVALGFRYPWTWSFVLLSKVTPGVGLVWFGVRREWRNLAIALAGTAIVIGISIPPGALAVARMDRAPRHRERQAHGVQGHPHPTLGPPARRVPAGGLGCPDRPAMDRSGGRVAGHPRDVVVQQRDAARDHPHPALAADGTSGRR